MSSCPCLLEDQDNFDISFWTGESKQKANNRADRLHGKQFDQLFHRTDASSDIALSTRSFKDITEFAKKTAFQEV